MPCRCACQRDLLPQSPGNSVHGHLDRSGSVRGARAIRDCRNPVSLPYATNTLPIRYRWENRLPRRRMLWRWLALVVTPYGLVPLLGVLIMLPSLLLWGLTSTRPPSVRSAVTGLGPGWRIDGVTRS